MPNPFSSAFVGDASLIVLAMRLENSFAVEMMFTGAWGANRYHGASQKTTPVTDRFEQTGNLTPIRKTGAAMFTLPHAIQLTF